jgi:hypothetical protein
MIRSLNFTICKTEEIIAEGKGRGYNETLLAVAVSWRFKFYAPCPSCFGSV